MAEINQHHPLNPADPPVRHNSGGVKSTPAGGEVPVDQYRKPIPQSQGGGGPRSTIEPGDTS